MEYALKKATAVTPSEKENRLKPSSHFPEKYFSSKSLEKKRQNTSQERIHDKRLLKKCSDMDVTLNEDQHEQMCEVIEQIRQVGGDGLDALFAEGDKQGVGQAFRTI